MAIEIVHEDTNELKSWGLGLEKIIERCIFCNDPTRYWSRVANKSICQSCAKERFLHELPERKRA